MGWQPKATGRRPPTADEFHLGMARSAYIEGHISVEEFERSVGHVLSGHSLNAQGLVPGSPVHPDLPMFGMPERE